MVMSTKNQLDKYRSFYNKTFSLPSMMRTNPISSLYGESLYESMRDSKFDNRTMLPFEVIGNPIRLTNLIRKYESNIEYVSEGLIKTYPKNKLISGYRKFCQSNLDSKLNSISIGDVFANPPAMWNGSDKIVDLTIEDENRPGVIGFVMPYVSGEDPSIMVKKLVDAMYVHGWNLSDTKIVPKDIERKSNIDCFVVVFEGKFHEIEVGVDDVMYHVSTARYFNGIQKNGIVPKSKSDKFKYPERIYLFNKASISEIVNYGVIKSNLLVANHETEYVSDDEFYVFKILGKNVSDLTFHIDQMYDGGVGGIEKCKAIFTYDNIPRDGIENVCWHYSIWDNIATKTSNVMLENTIDL